MIIATVADKNGNPVKILNGYFPQGDNIAHETKFPYKRQFYSDLMTYLDDHDPNEQIIVMGDINISPIDLDIGIGEPNKKRWLKTGKSSFQGEGNAFAEGREHDKRLACTALITMVAVLKDDQGEYQKLEHGKSID